MKKILVVLLALTLFPAVFAFAQEEGNGKHGRNREEGVGANPNPPMPEKVKPLRDNEESRPPQAEWQKEQKQYQEERQPQLSYPKRHDLNQGGQSNPNAVPHWGENRKTHDTNRDFGSQGQVPNLPNNQGFYGNGKHRGDNNGNISKPFQNEGGAVNGKHQNGFGNNQHQSEHLNPNQNGSIPPKLKEMGVRSVPPPIRDRSKLLTVDRSQSAIAFPKSGPGGQPIVVKTLSSRAMTSRTVQNHMATITGNAAFNAQINTYNNNEVRTNNYYWHTYNGFNYCHYYDPWGYHWYGWYIGPTCFWTRWYSNNWWWYDGGYDRWCYWHDGGWWWQDPYRVNVVYVYNNGDYTPVNSTQTYNIDSNQVLYQSNDGTRKVKVMGDSRDAFLYDTTDSPSFEPKYLVSGVKDVKFSDTSNGSALQIMLTLKNGSFQLFDGFGNRYNSGNND